MQEKEVMHEARGLKAPRPQYGIPETPKPQTPKRSSEELLEQLLDLQLQGYEPQDYTYQISATFPWVVDYKNRQYIYMFSSVAFTLTVEDLGSYSIPANTWTNVCFPQGLRCFAQNISTPFYIFIRAVNSIYISPNSGVAVNEDGISIVNDMFASNSGGPALSTGLSSQQNSTRLRTVTGKDTTSFPISPTLAGDISITATPAINLPLLPGMYLDLLGGGGAADRVYIADSFVPTASITTIPLRFPVVHANQNTAYVDLFNSFGATVNPVLPEGIIPVQLQLTAANGFMFPLTTAANSPVNPANALPAIPFVFDPDFGSAAQLQANYHFSSVPSQTLTGSGIKGNALAARTFKGCVIYINITSIGTGSVVVSLRGYDWNIGQNANYVIIQSAALTTNGLTILKVYPGLTAVANQVANDVLAPLSFIQVDGANSTTMEVDMALIA